MTDLLEYRWPASFARLPIDHGYALFGAISRTIPSMHEGSWQLGPVTGQPRGGDLRGPGTLTIRAPLSEAVLALNGARLYVGVSTVDLGDATVAALQSAPVLHARFVTVKNAMGQADLAPHIELALHEAVEHIPPFEIGRRRVMRIAGRCVVGFGVTIRDLDADDSRAIQAAGIGGRRRMGGGVFVPVPEPPTIEGRWFMTPYAVHRMLERHGAKLGLARFADARAWMIEDSREATRIHDGSRGAEVWAGRRPWKIRYVIGDPVKPGPGIKRPVVTVLPDERRS